MKKISERTFGLEIEMSDVCKSKLKLPDGYSFDKEEHLFNSDLTISSASLRYGCEVNTKPLRLRWNRFL